MSGCETTGFDSPSLSGYRRIGPRGKGRLIKRKPKNFEGDFTSKVLDGGLSKAVNDVVTPNYGIKCYGTESDVYTAPRANPGGEKLELERFDSPPKSGSDLNLWATNYFTETIASGGSIPLKSKKEKSFVIDGETISLPEKDWCNAAMEGSVIIKTKSGKKVSFNYSGIGSMQVNCAKYFRGKYAATGKVKFQISKSTYGEGVSIPGSKKNKSITQSSYSLVPYRTIAVDSRKIPYGSVIYIPSAKGTKVTLPDGSTFVHDGYFFAGDTGGGIKYNHIDVFTGNNNSNTQPFKFIKSSANGTFSAKVVEDKDIIEKMTALHTKRY